MNSIPRLLLASVIVSLTSTTLIQAEDWPQWLGPQRDSVWREEGIIDAFPPQGPRQLWRQKVGFGYAGPAVAQGRVFVVDYVTDEIPYPKADRRDQPDGQGTRAVPGRRHW